MNRWERAIFVGFLAVFFGFPLPEPVLSPERRQRRARGITPTLRLNI
jgi:hypothetical protein